MHNYQASQNNQLFSSSHFNPVYFGESENAKRILDYDWALTELGPLYSWPLNLLNVLSICLNSRIPMVIWWGPNMRLFYNDAYNYFLGQKHPTALGQPGNIIWAEIWCTLQPLVEQVLKHGIATWSENNLFYIERSLPNEEVFGSFSFSPIYGTNKNIQGMLSVCMETTGLMISNRRLETLRKLAILSTDAQDVGKACESAIDVIALNPYDIAGAAIYLTHDKQASVILKACIGITDADYFPPQIDLVEDKSLWPIDSVVNQHCKVELNIQELGITLHGSLWPDPIHTVILIPILSNFNATIGCLIVAVSPRKLLDEHYRGFLDMIASHIGNIITAARAQELETQQIAELAQLNQTKTAFFNNVSHEFRTPLTLILSPLEELRANLEVFDKAKTYTYLESAYRNTIRLLKLINTILDFARIEEKRTKPYFELIDFTYFIQEIASMFRSTIERAGLTFQVECEPLNELIYVDKEMWEKIIFNLLSNAFKYTLEGGITLSLKKCDNLAIICIKDTGIGIAPNELAHIFERFYRIEGTRGRTHEGSGIGLALVKELVRMHKGDIRVRSELGKETEFIITLPLNLSKEDKIENKQASSLTITHASAYLDEANSWISNNMIKTSSIVDETFLTDMPAHILIVDDNKDMREYLSHLLSEKWLIETAADGNAALTLLNQKSFDLVLTDIMMPGLNGVGLLKAIRNNANLKNIPVILLSARDGEESRLCGFDAGADDYLTKPFAAREVIARVNAQLKLALRHRLARENELLHKEKQVLKKINQEKDILLALLSHELMTPLTTILCRVQSLLRRAPPGEAVKQTLKLIEEDVLMLTRLINDLLTMSNTSLNNIINNESFI